MYLTYDEYVNEYGGRLPEDAFRTAEQKAEAEIRYLTFANGDIFAKPDPAVKLAVCAAMDVIVKDEQSTAAAAGAPGVKSESNDGYSVTYVTDAQDGQTAQEALRRRVAQAVRVPLLPTGWLRRSLNRCGRRP